MKCLLILAITTPISEHFDGGITGEEQLRERRFRILTPCNMLMKSCLGPNRPGFFIGKATYAALRTFELQKSRTLWQLRAGMEITYIAQSCIPAGPLFAFYRSIKCVIAFSLHLLDRVTKPLCKSFTSGCHRVFTRKQRSERKVHTLKIHQPFAARSKCTP